VTELWQHNMATKRLHSRNTKFTLNSEYRMTTHKKICQLLHRITIQEK